MTSTTLDAPLLSVRGLGKHFGSARGFLHKSPPTIQAVNGVNLDVQAGETLSLVGESGCGKSTTGRLIARLLDASQGEITFEGRNVTHAQGTELRALRRDIQMIFQDPYSSLNPRLTIGEIIAAPFIIQKVEPAGGVERAVRDLMSRVGLNPDHFGRYPREFSGGQRQRISIARALALKPKLVICDEPVSALDVSVQAQVVNLLMDLQSEFGLSYLFIAHDLAVVKHISARIAVMYLGQIMETAPVDMLYSSPAHPYTRALISAAPIPDPDRARERQRIALTGDVPSAGNPPMGCPFHTRCPSAQVRCKSEKPKLEAIGEHRLVACHFPDETALLTHNV